MAKLNGLPVYQIKIDESLKSNLGVDFISLVDYPAIETNWIALSKADKKIPAKLYFNADLKLLYGPALIPDMPIYRYDEEMGEYYVVFSKEEIAKIARKFQRQLKSLNLNYMHQPNSQIDAVVQELWLTGKTDKSKDLGFDLPEGSWFIGSYIESEDFWTKEVKSGNVRGYSIEGFLDLELKKINMSKQKFEVARMADGAGDVYIDGPIAVDSMVFSNYPSITLVNGVKQVTQYPVWQDTILLEDGSILTLKDAKIIKIEKKQGMKKSKFTMQGKTTDGMELKTSGDAFAVGGDAVVVAADGTESPADGEYTLENGDIVKCAAGKITEVVQATQQEELSPEEVAIIQKAIKPTIDAYEARIKTLEEKLAKIPGAVASTIHTDPPGGAGNKTALSKVKALLNKNKKSE